MGLTDTERGARLAFDQASQKVRQGDLFLSGDERQFWQGVFDAAAEQLHECQAHREALRG